MTMMIVVIIMRVMLRLMDHHHLRILGVSEQIVEHYRDRQLRHHDALQKRRFDGRYGAR